MDSIVEFSSRLEQLFSLIENANGYEGIEATHGLFESSLLHLLAAATAASVRLSLSDGDSEMLHNVFANFDQFRAVQRKLTLVETRSAVPVASQPIEFPLGSHSTGSPAKKN